MDEFTLYQWVVIGLLTVIALAAWHMAATYGRALDAMTRRLEDGLSSIHVEIAHLADANRPKPPGFY